MKNEIAIFDATVRELERQQARIGKLQQNLLKILTDDVVDHWDAAAQSAMIRLEAIQRQIGETQVELLNHMPTGENKSSYLQKRSPSVRGDEPVIVPDDTVAVAETKPILAADQALAGSRPALTNPKVWLEAHNIKLRSIRAESGIDAAADRAACFLGDHFTALEPFYDYLKQRVTGNKSNKWFPVMNEPANHIPIMIQFGNRLKDCCFLSEFSYIKKDRTLLVEVLGDGRVKNFFTGDWMERYIQHIVRDICTKANLNWTDENLLHNANVTLPTGNETEFDLLIGLPNDRLVWLESKSGQWRNAITHLKNIKQNSMNLGSEDAALVLLEQLDEQNLASASTLTGFSILHLTQLEAWLRQVVSRS